MRVWRYPIYFDHLPVFRLGKVLRLTRSIDDRNPCLSLRGELHWRELCRRRLSIGKSSLHAGAVIQFFHLHSTPLDLILVHQQIVQRLATKIEFYDNQTTIPEIVLINLYSSSLIASEKHFCQWSNRYPDLQSFSNGNLHLNFDVLREELISPSISSVVYHLCEFVVFSRRCLYVQKIRAEWNVSSSIRISIDVCPVLPVVFVCREIRVDRVTSSVSLLRVIPVDNVSSIPNHLSSASDSQYERDLLLIISVERWSV